MPVIDIVGSSLFVFARHRLECRIAKREYFDNKFVVSIYGAGISIPPLLVLLKLLGPFFSIQAHRKGFMEGEYDFKYKGNNYLLEYDDYEVIRISVSCKTAFQTLITKFSNKAFVKIDSVRWKEVEAK